MRGDLFLNFVVRISTGAAIAFLLILRAGTIRAVELQMPGKAWRHGNL